MLSNRKLVACCAIAFCCNIALIVLFVTYNTGQDRCFVTISAKQQVTIVLPDSFVSFGIDTSKIEDFHDVDFTNQRLRQLAKELAPARMRLGGTMSDRLIFSENAAKEHVNTISDKLYPSKSKSVSVATSGLPYFIMSGNEWTAINEFCNATNIKLLFTLNALLRTEDKWSYENALNIIKYSNRNRFEIDWQLGNEPNSFYHHFGITVTPQTLAKDFKKLRELLNLNGYNKSLLVGPDTTRPQPKRPECLQYMIDFLGSASNTIDVRSWHQYYLNGRIAKLEDFWKPETFDLLEEQILTMKNHTKNYTNIPMWLTETSTAYGGGAPGLSDSYAGSPLWLDKLGLAAKHNITTVVRQSLVGGNYSLIDKDLKPLPDWWITVLYKKLVGNKVLEIHCDCTPFQRMYAHCTNRNYIKDKTAITIYAINLEFKKKRFTLKGSGLHTENLDIDEYIIRAPSNNQRTTDVLLNGWKLYYDKSLPVMQPVHIKYGRIISMPPYSIGFWVVKNTNIQICK